MTKFKRILLAVSCVVVSLCFVLSAFVLGSFAGRSRSVHASGNSELIGTWVFNSYINQPSNIFSLSFTSNRNEYIQIGWALQEGLYYKSRFSPDTVYYESSNSWVKEGFRTINITDVSSLKNESEFISWLTANAVKQGQSSDYDEGFNAGYEQGLSDGYNNGYSVGHTEGYNVGLSATLDNPVSFFLSPLNSFMSIDLFGKFSLGDVFSVILFVSLGLIVIKMFAGG